MTGSNLDKCCVTVSCFLVAILQNGTINLQILEAQLTHNRQAFKRIDSYYAAAKTYSTLTLHLIQDT